MTFPKQVPVWIHIDHINNAGGRVWAVAVPSRKKYFVCHYIEINIPLTTRYRKTQPRAYLVGKAGYIRITERNKVVWIGIYRRRKDV